MRDLEPKLNQAMREVLIEFARAQEKFPTFSSPHEGYAVLLEEVDELWDIVKRQYADRPKEEMRKEAMQVAAMALRFMYDLT